MKKMTNNGGEEKSLLEMIDMRLKHDRCQVRKFSIKFNKLDKEAEDKNDLMLYFESEIQSGQLQASHQFWVDRYRDERDVVWADAERYGIQIDLYTKRIQRLEARREAELKRLEDEHSLVVDKITAQVNPINDKIIADVNDEVVEKKAVGAVADVFSFVEATEDVMSEAATGDVVKVCSPIVTADVFIPVHALIESKVKDEV